MKHIKFQIITVASAMLMLLASCNKDLEQFTETPVTPVSGPTLNEVMASNTSDSLYYRMVKKIGLDAVLADSTKFHTLFVTPDSSLKRVLSALAASQQPPIPLPPSAPNAYFEAFIDALPAAIVGGIVSYNTVPQKLLSTDIGSSFPNFIYPTILNPSPSTQTLIGPVVRLALYPSTTNGAWLNNVPIVGVDQMASNGVIHHTASMLIPSQRYLWDRINTDTTLTYLKAAIQRADSGQTTGTLQGYLSSFGPDFTVFAPVDSAFKAFIIGALVSQGGLSIGTAQFLLNTFGTTILSNPSSIPVAGPAIAAVITPMTVKGILVYHVLGARAYTNNFSSTATSYPTLLNTVPGLSSHPGLNIKSTFTSPNPFVVSLTIDDVNPNTSATNVIINRRPLLSDPVGSSDQSYVNGVLHKINQVLLPQ